MYAKELLMKLLAEKYIFRLKDQCEVNEHGGPMKHWPIPGRLTTVVKSVIDHLTIHEQVTPPANGCSLLLAHLCF
jgi:hypothetical protein